MHPNQNTAGWVMGKRISDVKRATVLSKTNGVCSYCGVILNQNDFVIDHVHPRAKGGNNNINNLLPSCKSCNAAKCAKSLEQFRRMCAFRDVYNTSLFNQAQIDFIYENGMAEKIGVDTSFIFHFENMELNHETV